MKKRLLLLIAGVFLLAGSAFARPVDANKARTVAETYLRAMGMKNTAGLVNVTAQTPFTEFYIFAAEEGGFILVSADDCARPVLGYSTTSKFKTKDIPVNVRWWLEGYEKEIRYGKAQAAAQTLPMADMETESQWQMLTSGQMPPRPLTTAVTPLLTTTWDQYPYYNALCPYSADEEYTGNNRIVTGCVATATAQVMKYHNHPTTGYGSHSYYHQNSTVSFGTLSANFGATTYQWSNMPNALTSTSSTAQVNAVATLMYHIGVADEMNYNFAVNGGSGAMNENYYGTISPSSKTSLMKYFKYRPDMATIYRDEYSNDDYCAMLRGELDQQRPILYGGSHTSGGHSFVCDGYNNAGDFHFNWGWGGTYDGYFSMGALNPHGGGAGSNGSGTYNMGNDATIGIRPNTSWNATGNTTITVNTTGGDNGCSTFGAGTYAFGDTVVLEAYATGGYRFYQWSDGERNNSRELIATGGTYNFTAVFEPLQGDTLGYCTEFCRNVTRYGTPTWGVRLPASVLTAGRYLTSAMLFVGEEGTYTLNVYLGNNLSTPVASSQAVVFGEEDINQWYTFPLTTSVQLDGTQDVVLSFTCSDANYPATVTTWSGNINGFLFGEDLTAYSDTYTFMIRGIFSEQTASQVDNNCVIQVFPYTQDFDGTSVPCWNIYDQNQDSTNWEWFSNAGYNGTSCLGINTQNGANDLTLAPRIATPGNYTISWKAAAYWAPNRNETYLVVKLGDEGIDTIFSEVLSSSEYVDRNASFTVAQGDTVRIGFWAITDTGGYLLLDNVVIDESSNVPSSYTVTTTVNNPAWGSVTAGGTYPAGSTINLVATPNNGYEFYKWVVNGTDYPYGNAITVTVNVDINAIACFKPIDATFDAGNIVYWTGTGSRQAVVAINWADTALAWGVRFSADTITVQAALDIIAASDPRISYTSNSGHLMNITFSENGTSHSGGANSYWESLRNGTYDMGMSQTIVNGDFEKLAASAAGTTYDSVYFDDYGWLYYNAYTMAIHAVDTPAVVNNEYIVTASSNNSVWGTVTGGGAYSDGDYAMLTAIANSGYQFAYWSDGSIDNPHYLEVTSDTTIIAVFTTQRPVAVGDTVSYCGNDEFYINMGAGRNIYWGIMLPSSNLSGRNYLKGVNLSVPAAGTYEMSIYHGGTDVPGTLAHTQTVVFDENHLGWQEILLDATCAINGQNLWITFHNNDINYPANGCYYVGSANSDWFSLNGTEWSHLAGDYGWNVTWMIKAITSATQPTLPAPSVAVSGSIQVGVGANAYFSAIHTDGVTPVWTLSGATPATATGDTVIATWNTPGSYNVIATVSNTYGTSADTLTVLVVDYSVGDTVSYVLDRPFYTKVGTGSSSAFSWGIMVPADYMANRRQVSKVLVGLKEPGSYSVRIFQGGEYAPQTLVYSDVFSVTSADTAQMYYNYIPANPIAVSNNSNLWVVFHSDNLAYPAASTHHTTEANSDWVSLNDTNWYHLPQLGVNTSWMIKVVTSADSVAPIELYTVTATSNNPAWGTVSGGGTYNAGATITLTATANSGYHFVEWQDGNTQNPRTITVTANATYTATFAANAAPGNCDVTTLPWNYSFINDSISNCWTNVDADGDGLTWMFFQNYGAVSFSYVQSGGNYYSLTPDNWLISPKVTLPASGAEFHYTYMNLAANYPDHIGVFVSTTDTVRSSFTLLEEYTAVAADTVWQTRTVNLGAYAGQQVYIAIRHYNSDDNYAFIVGSVSVTAGSAPVQQYTVTATSADATMGSVTGGGTYNAGSTVTLTATANSGYHFVQWQDGNTDNPRTVTVTGNATYTATFAVNAPNQYTVTAISNNNAWGTVSGGGTYNAGDSATLEAHPADGYRFVQWNDGVTDNPRTVVVTADVTYTATFEANVSIDNVNGLSVVLYPNPANGYVTLSALPAAARITIIDAAGRLCGSWPSQGEQTTLDISHLSAGQYYLRITGEGLNTVKKLVVE